MAYLAYNDHKTEIDVVLDDIVDDLAALPAEGRQILAHCHGDASQNRAGPSCVAATDRMPVSRGSDHVVASKWPYLGRAGTHRHAGSASRRDGCR